MIRELIPRSCLCRLFILLSLLGASCVAQQQPANEEYRVYEAVLKLINSIPTSDPHVAIYDRTLSSHCGGDADNPVLAKGCTFLWVKPDTDQDVERMLRRGFHGLESSTWKNFKLRNATSTTLHDPLSTPWKHRFTGPDAPADGSPEWQSPDLTIYLSQVGFNSKKTEAIVYVLTFSYVGRAETSGDYLRLRLGADKSWALAGQVSYLTRGNTLSASLSSARNTSTLARRQRERKAGHPASLAELRQLPELQ